MAQYIVFESSVDSLLRAVRDDLSPRARARLLDLGLEVDRPLQPSYPAEQWAHFVEAIAEELYPGEAPQEAHRHLAARTVDAFQRSTKGRALFSLVRLLGPDRTIGRMTRNFRTGANYLETRSERRGPGSYEVWINEVNGVPGFYLGMLEAGMLHVGAQNLEARILETDGHQCRLAIRWSNGV